MLELAKQDRRAREDEARRKADRDRRNRDMLAVSDRDLGVGFFSSHCSARRQPIPTAPARLQSLDYQLLLKRQEQQRQIEEKRNLARVMQEDVDAMKREQRDAKNRKQEVQRLETQLRWGPIFRPRPSCPRHQLMVAIPLFPPCRKLEMEAEAKRRFDDFSENMNDLEKNYHRPVLARTKAPFL